MIIALDLGGVCADVNSDIMRDELLKRLMGRFSLAELAAKEKELRRHWEAMERGKLGTDDFFDRLHRLSGGLLSAEELRSLWCSQIRGPFPGTFEAAQEAVKKGHELVFFSNTSAIHLREIECKCPIWELRKGGVYSFETGFMKPEPEIYACFEKEFGQPGVFFDDNPANIAAAGERGWNAVRFRSAADLLGVL
ncbi:MAG: HAD-IA family hydrolase [Lentisphaeria bacterium]|nr:HAD-IA family hydrolase [Lentisphaeria bacterium]